MATTKEIELTGSVTLDLSQSPKTPEDLATFTATAKALQVVDSQSFNIATVMCSKEKDWINAVDAFYAEGRELALRSHRWFTSRIKSHKDSYKAREFLEPRMKAWRAAEDAKRRAEELRLQREADEARRKTEESARLIQAEADRKAAELRRQGEMSAARNLQEATSAQVEQIRAEAEASDIGTILPDLKPVGGPGEARKWKAREVIKEWHPDWGIMQVIKAIAEGRYELRHVTPVRGSDPERKRLIDFDPIVLNELGNRLCKESLGCPGIEGYNDWGFRFSKTGVEKFTRSGASINAIPPSEESGW